MVEEPEIHLHPAAQARFAEVLATIVGDEQKRLLITTHSEHLLLGFLTQVAKGKLRPQDLAIYYLELNTEGTSTASRLNVTDKGGVEGGLKGFFETSLAELKGYLESIMQSES